MRYRPEMTRAGIAATDAVVALDEYGRERECQVAGELPLTIYVDKREIVTLMTLGTRPEALTLGYLRNQGLIDRLESVRSVQVDWETDSVAVTTTAGSGDWDDKLAHRTVTTGCGQGSVFGNMLEKVSGQRVVPMVIRQSAIFALLETLSAHNEVYRQAGAVHGCALCEDGQPCYFVEDVGRHNAVDAIAGLMWLDGCGGEGKVFYTTGRLTSEMVIKVVQMGIPVLLSRSGVTRMGLSLARELGVTLIARAKGRHFLVYSGADRVVLDAPPAPAGRVSGG